MAVDPLVQVKETVDHIEREMNAITKRADSVLAPLRETAFRKFPTLFILLTTAGVVITFLAIEKIVERYELLVKYPWVMLGVGIGILILTGRLYKKLG